MRILLIEDDPMIGEAVFVALKDAAYAVDWVKDGTTANRVLENTEHQAVLLDLGLPKRDGLEVLRRLRKAANTVPVLIITARDDIDDRIKGLDSGADDYLCKPFDLNEMLARLRAIIRRHGGQATPTLSNGKLSLDPTTHEARCGDVVERCLGKVRFLILYFGSAIFGNLLSAAYELSTGSFYESIGASGAVFGLTGALLFLVIVKKGAAAGISLKRAVFAVVLSLYAGFGSAYVNNAAHVGGLLSGFLLGFLLSIIPPVFRKKGFSHEKR